MSLAVQAAGNVAASLDRARDTVLTASSRGGARAATTQEIGTEFEIGERNLRGQKFCCKNKVSSSKVFFVRIGKIP